MEIIPYFHSEGFHLKIVVIYGVFRVFICVTIVRKFYVLKIIFTTGDCVRIIFRFNLTIRYTINRRSLDRLLLQTIIVFSDVSYLKEIVQILFYGSYDFFVKLSFVSSITRYLDDSRRPFSE